MLGAARACSWGDDGRKGPAAIALLFLLAGAPGAALAEDWSGLGGNNNWTTAGNWVGGFAPPTGGGTTLTFGAAGATFTPAVDVPHSLNHLIVSGATPNQFTGSTLSFF